MPGSLCACSTDRCGRFTAFWRPLLGSGPRRQAPEGPQKDASAALALDPRSCILELDGANGYFSNNLMVCIRTLSVSCWKSQRFHRREGRPEPVEDSESSVDDTANA
ncbi:hypothetical protein NDU88_003921 [Pleurodeles waltl]|uniref:Uncharacterized protein n=1 Tax=Pleurodeles waltl TaxID=8319 RepID=A0AAV7NM14_PLEWA|nr:hypothetical protein NDU88_003921 [Pleurodeles waltl]